MQDDDARVVRVTNISNFDFTPAMGARFGGRDFPLKAGESFLYPFTIGDHIATHLARQILIRKAPVRDEKELDGRGSDRPLWDDQVINDLKAKILTDAHEEPQAPVLSEDDRLAARVAELNRETGSQSTATTYKDKAEVIEELKKRGVAYDARASKATLEALLK